MCILKKHFLETQQLKLLSGIKKQVVLGVINEESTSVKMVERGKCGIGHTSTYLEIWSVIYWSYDCWLYTQLCAYVQKKDFKWISVQLGSSPPDGHQTSITESWSGGCRNNLVEKGKKTKNRCWCVRVQHVRPTLCGRNYTKILNTEIMSDCMCRPSRSIRTCRL